VQAVVGCGRIVVDQSIGCVPPIFTGPRQAIPVVSYHLKYQSGLETSSSAASLSRSPTWYIASRLTSGSTTVMPSPSAGPIGTRKGASVFHFLRKRDTDTSDALCRVQPRASRLSPRRAAISLSSWLGLARTGSLLQRPLSKVVTTSLWGPETEQNRDGRDGASISRCVFAGCVHRVGQA